ncbi:uncharacterized protein STEHIDRAFT_163394 [Stereum hirsutum FP-91666 SS1]|uniref:Uncharacterized protein n=1 Tax=Stereum hirsutum (strain FP-91666) TaxID=721885 RepID=R7RZU3_STEHR|nr:uncharacterized protein STEHIDRAFT_163394 [Stereum hirsutum FP-91666 SS1]EIM79837.1 hypothetical protein STEHIDRAFT_163394 [Stereum hirsutum FP-91666 SS1]
MTEIDESEVDELWPSDIEELSPPGPERSDPFPIQVKQEDDDSKNIVVNKKKKAEYQSLGWPDGRNPSVLDASYGRWVSHRFTPPGSIQYPPISTYRNYDKIHRHRSSLEVSAEERAVVLENRKLELEGTKTTTYINRLALDSEYPSDYPGWWNLANDICLKDDAARKRTAAQFLADAIEYEGDPFSWDLVLGELKLRIEEHLDAVGFIKRKYSFPAEDDPFRPPNLEARAHAIAAYTQILDLLTEGLPSLLAAYQDEALILQGKRIPVDFDLPQLEQRRL